jgi:hypothetical protein
MIFSYSRVTALVNQIELQFFTNAPNFCSSDRTVIDFDHGAIPFWVLLTGASGALVKESKSRKIVLEI